MKQTINIDIMIADKNRVGEFKSLYKMSVQIDDGVNFDYVSVLRGLRCIYPPESIISFRILP